MAMSDDKLAAIIEGEIRDAMGSFDGDLSADREDALDYYYGRPYGDEQEDRSKIVTRELLEAVENAMPSLMRIFTASGRYVEFDPMGPEDIEQARIDTDAVRHVFTKQNPGFTILYNWFKDALRQRNGIVKVWYESTEETLDPRKQYGGLTDDDMLLIEENPELELLEHTERAETEGMNGDEREFTLHDVIVRHFRKRGRVNVENVPFEELLISASASHLDPMKARFVCHQCDKTISELRSMGVPESVLERIATGSELEHQSERYARNQTVDEDNAIRSELNRDSQVTTYYECRMLIDYDEDGIDEWRRITYVGNEIIENVEAVGENWVSFRALSPFPQPHRFLGVGYYEMLEDIQHVSSVLLRNALDAIYKANNTGIAYKEGDVEYDDIADRRFDRLIACSRPPQEALLYEPQSQIPPQTFDLMNRIDQIGRRRTGVGEGISGLSENALANAKAGVVRTVNERGTEMQELIARVFAETGVKDLFWDIHKLLRENHDEDLVFPYQGQFVATRPTLWRERQNLTVNVGLGSGDRDRDLAINREIRQVQQTLVEFGMTGTLVSGQNIFNSLADLIDIAGKADPNRYFTNPGNMPIQPQQQGGAEQGQGDGQAQAYLQAEQMKAQAKMQTDQGKLQLEAIKQQRMEALKRLEMAQDHLEKMTELELKYNRDVPGAAV